MISFYYIFLRRNTEEAEISGFMGGGIPNFQGEGVRQFFQAVIFG
jgi:hypothetical protein